MRLKLVAATVGWWRPAVWTLAGDGGAAWRDPASSCSCRIQSYRIRRGRSSRKTRPEASQNSSLSRLLPRAAIALEPPANFSPQPTSNIPKALTTTSRARKQILISVLYNNPTIQNLAPFQFLISFRLVFVLQNLIIQIRPN